MGLYNFKQMFEAPILAGEKTHTIRAIRKYPSKPGDTLHLYTGLRTKNAKLLMRVECVKVEEISIGNGFGSGSVFIDENELSGDEREQLARRDGFSSFHEMLKFWQTPKNRLPFFGHIIHWRYDANARNDGKTRKAGPHKHQSREGNERTSRKRGRARPSLAGQRTPAILA